MGKVVIESEILALGLWPLAKATATATARGLSAADPAQMNADENHNSLRTCALPQIRRNRDLSPRPFAELF